LAESATILDDLVAYVAFDDEDRTRLHELHTRLAPAFPAIAERFYDAVFANPNTAAVLQNPEQVERLRVTLIDWMATGLIGPFDDAFYLKRSRIGRRHVQIGLAQHYMFTAINVVRTAYLDHITAAYASREALRVVRSVDKLFDIELALMLRHYQLDSEEKRVRVHAERVAALQTLTSGLAHEVRNPLNAAHLQLAVLERRAKKLGDAATLVAPAEMASAEITRIAELVDELERFATAQELRFASTDLAKLAREVLGDVVTGDPVAMAKVDATRLREALDHVVRGARASQHAVTAHITTDGARVTLAIVERGPPTSAMEVHAAAAGLGLASARHIVALHEGTIDVRRDEASTTTTITLPA